jgi:uncharacterized protein YeaO (DUF488 family)
VAAGGVKGESAGGYLVEGSCPTDKLRKWFAHDPKKCDEFRKRYREELEAQKEWVQQLKRLEKEHGMVTLLFAARDEKHNNAVALKEILK